MPWLGAGASTSPMIFFWQRVLGADCQSALTEVGHIAGAGVAGWRSALVAFARGVGFPDQRLEAAEAVPTAERADVIAVGIRIPLQEFDDVSLGFHAAGVHAKRRLCKPAVNHVRKPLAEVDDLDEPGGPRGPTHRSPPHRCPGPRVARRFAQRPRAGRPDSS